MSRLKCTGGIYLNPQIAREFCEHNFFINLDFTTVYYVAVTSSFAHPTVYWVLGSGVLGSMYMVWKLYDCLQISKNFIKFQFWVAFRGRRNRDSPINWIHIKLTEYPVEPGERIFLLSISGQKLCSIYEAYPKNSKSGTWVQHMVRSNIKFPPRKYPLDARDNFWACFCRILDQVSCTHNYSTLPNSKGCHVYIVTPHFQISGSVGVVTNPLGPNMSAIRGWN